MTAIFIGLLFLISGAWGLVRWFPDFLVFARGLIPFSLFLGGVMALIAGISSMSRRGDKKN